MRRLGILAILAILATGAFAQGNFPAPTDLSRVQRMKLQGNYPTAMQIIQSKLAEDLPTEERLVWLEQLALILQQLGRQAEARQVYQQMADVPGFATSSRRLTVPMAVADSFAREGRFEQAVSVLAQAVASLSEAERNGRQGLDLLYTLAGTRLSSGDYARAAEDFLALLKHPMPDRREHVLVTLVRLYGYEALTPLQLDEVLSSVAESERNFSFLNALAEAYRVRDEERRAADVYMEITRRFPEMMLGSLSYIGPVLKRMELVPQLVVAVKEMWEADRGNINLTLLYARVLRLEDRTDEALGVLEASADPRARRERADMLFGLGRYEEAAEAYRQLLTGSPNNPAYLDRLGAIQLRMGKEKEAVETWRSLVQGQGASPQSYQMLSDILQREGLSREAVEVLRESRRKFPQTRSSSMSMAYLWLMQGDYARSLEAFSEYVKVVGDHYEFVNQNIFQQARGEQEQIELLVAVGELVSASSQYDPTQRKWLRELRARLLVKLGRYDEAFDLVRAESESPGKEMYQLALMFEAQGATEWAVRAYAAVPPDALTPMASTLLRLASLQEQLGQLADARATIERASAALLPAELALLPRLFLKQVELDLGLKRPGAALAALNPPSATAALLRSPELLEHAQLLRGEAYSMLGSLDRARQELIPLEKSTQRGLRLLAMFQLGNISLWKNEPDAAVDYYRAIMEHELDHELANDVLDLAISAKLLDPEQMARYSHALYYEWQGRRDDAAEEWRMLAALVGEGDLAAQALSQVADIYAASGEVLAASAEYGKALRVAKSPDVVGRIRWDLIADTADLATPVVRDAEYRSLIMDYPDTLFADMARRRLRADAALPQSASRELRIEPPPTPGNP